MEERPLPAPHLTNEPRPFVYLSGAMDAAPDYGIGWRLVLEAFFCELDMACFNPCREEEALLGLSHQDLMALREKDRARYIESVRKLIARDLRAIRTQTRWVVAYIDEHVRAGTYGEVVFAYSQGIPVYVIWKLPEEHISGWILACSERIFFSIQECMEFFASSTSAE